MKIINCHNLYHLGDCIQTLHFLIKAAEKNNIKFNFFCNPSYHEQLNEFVDSNDRINLTKNPPVNENSFQTWIGGYNHGRICEISDELFKQDSDQSTHFFVLWNFVSQLMEIECPFSSKNDMIYDENVLSLQPKHDHQYDYLFINSKNNSIPFPNFEKDCSDMVEKLKKSNKAVITTSKVNDFPCTVEYNLSVVEIAKLSKNVKNIIAVNTGPIHLCLNKWTIENVNKFIVWSPAETFNHGPKFKSVKSLEEINESYL